MKDTRRVFEMRKSLIVLAVLIVLFVVAVGAVACEMQFRLTEPDGTVQRLTPDRAVFLAAGERYTLEVQFIPDHRRCDIGPEGTLYLLQEEKWKVDKEHLPLQLLSVGAWEPDQNDLRSGTWVQDLVFEPEVQGEWALEVVRICPKGGYDEFLLFHVQ